MSGFTCMNINKFFFFFLVWIIRHTSISLILNNLRRKR